VVAVGRLGLALVKPHSFAIAAMGFVEQEIRAHPRLYDAFYRAVTRDPRLRRTAGRVKHRVRSSAHTALTVPEPPDSLSVRRRREESVATRLGLRA
jgi:hypothetical protein